MTQETRKRCDSPAPHWHQKLLNAWRYLQHQEGRKSFHILSCLCNATESKTPKVLAATSLEGTTHTYTESTMGLEEANEIHCTTYSMEDLYLKTQHDSFFFLPSFLSFWLVLNKSFVYHIAHVKVKSLTAEDVPKNSKSTHFIWRETSMWEHVNGLSKEFLNPWNLTPFSKSSNSQERAGDGQAACSNGCRINLLKTNNQVNAKRDSNKKTPLQLL